MDHVSGFEHGGVRAIYRDVLGLEILYGGEGGCFSSLRIEDAPYPILNLEQGEPVTRWGRLIFHVEDVDACWTYLRGKGFIRRVRETPPGENAISTCPTRMGTTCRLRARSSSLPAAG